MPPVVAVALRLEVVAHQIDAGVLEVARLADGHPTRERAGAVERHVGEALGPLHPHDDEVGLRVRGVREEDVLVQELRRRDDVDELGVAAAVGRRVRRLRVLGGIVEGAAGHVRRHVERMLRVLAVHREGAVGVELGDLAERERERRAHRRSGIPGEPGARHRADEAPGRRLLDAVVAVAVADADVLAAEGPDRRDLLVRGVVAAGLDGQGRGAAPGADRLVGLDHAAAERRALGELEHLPLGQQVGLGDARGRSGHAGTGDDGRRRLDGDGGAVFHRDELHEGRAHRVAAEGVDGDVVGGPGRGRQEERGAGHRALAAPIGVDVVRDHGGGGGEVERLSEARAVRRRVRRAERGGDAGRTVEVEARERRAGDVVEEEDGYLAGGDLPAGDRRVLDVLTRPRGDERERRGVEGLAAVVDREGHRGRPGVGHERGEARARVPEDAVGGDGVVLAADVALVFDRAGARRHAAGGRAPLVGGARGEDVAVAVDQGVQIARAVRPGAVAADARRVEAAERGAGATAARRAGSPAAGGRRGEARLPRGAAPCRVMDADGDEDEADRDQRTVHVAPGVAREGNG